MLNTSLQSWELKRFKIVLKADNDIIMVSRDHTKDKFEIVFETISRMPEMTGRRKSS